MIGRIETEALQALAETPSDKMLAKEAKIIMKIKADSGYSCEYEGRVSAQQWLEAYRVALGEVALQPIAAEVQESRLVIDHLGDLLAHQMALTDRLTAENAALEAQAITDRKRANATMSDAVMWQFSCADGAHNGQPLLVKVWLQRKEAERSANAALARVAVLETETERWRQAALDGLTRTTGLKAELAAARAEIEHLRSRTEDRIHDY